MHDMQTRTVSLRRFLTDSRVQKAAAAGVLTRVTYRGRLYFEVHPPARPRSCIGAGCDLAGDLPTDGRVPESEWKGKQ